MLLSVSGPYMSWTPPAPQPGDGVFLPVWTSDRCVHLLDAKCTEATPRCWAVSHKFPSNETRIMHHLHSRYPIPIALTSCSFVGSCCRQVGFGRLM